MLDIKNIINNKENYIERLALKNVDPKLIEEAVFLYNNKSEKTFNL